MPIPKPRKDEKDNHFISRCMSDSVMKKEYPDQKQRSAICINQTKGNETILDKVLEIIDQTMSCEECEDSYEEIDLSNLYVPADTEYLDFGEPEEIVLIASYKYMDPVTQEIFYFNQLRDYRKNGRKLIYQGKNNASEYQGKKVKLNKPFRTPDGPKKFSVYVKNEKGNVVKVNFGDPNMKIKKNIPERRKSFRARHNCDNPGPKWKARYWSCKAW